MDGPPVYPAIPSVGSPSSILSTLINGSEPHLLGNAHANGSVHSTPSRHSATPALDALLYLALKTRGEDASSVPDSPVLGALDTELQRVLGLVNDSYNELLAGIADAGEQLPPQGADAAAAARFGLSAQVLAGLEQRCSAMSAGLLELEEFVRANVTALAQAAMRYDANAAAELGNGAAPAKRVSPVFSHSDVAATEQGQRYTSSLPQDLYHQAVYQIMAVQHVGPGGSSDAVLWGISLLYTRLRYRQEVLDAVAAALSGQEKGADEWRTTDTFERKNFKYWVHPSNVLRLKLACARHLPVLVYGQASPLEAGETDPESLRHDGSAITGLISSVYFDNPEMHCFHTRLRKENEARVVRVRWYGQVDMGAAAAVQVAGAGLKKHLTSTASLKHSSSLQRILSFRQGSSSRLQPSASLEKQGSAPLKKAASKREVNVFVERKTHYESWSGLKSIKERAPLPLSQLSALVTGSLANGNMTATPGSKEGKEARQAQLLAEVQHFLTSMGQAPVLRTEYLRTAFQAYDANNVRISLDMDMLMIREQQLQHDGSLQGHSGPLGDGDAVRFPYAVLEIKLQDQELPEWIQDLQASDILVDAKGFSKFVHGSALLYPDAVQASPPWFVLDERTGTMTPATIEEMGDRTDKLEQAAAPWLFPDAKKAATNTPAPDDPQASSRSSRIAWLRSKLPLGHGSSSGSSGALSVSPGTKPPLSDVVDNPLLQLGQGSVALGSAHQGAAGAQQLQKHSGDLPSSGDLHIDIERLSSPINASPFSAQAHGRPAAADGWLEAKAGKQAAAMDIESGLPAAPAGGALNSAFAAAPASAAAFAAAPAANTGTAAMPASSRAKVSVRAPKQLLKAFMGHKKATGKKSMSGKPSGEVNEHMTGMKGNGPRANALVRTRIEPKTFFAAERTYLAWMQIAVLIMLTGLGLLAGATFEGTGQCDMACRASKIAGTMITPMSVLFMIYSLYMYKMRSIQIMRRETVRYDDQRGPVVLTLLLIVCVIVSLTLELITFDKGGEGGAPAAPSPIVGR